MGVRERVVRPYHTVKIWEVIRADSAWPCLGTIAVHTDAVLAVMVWEGRAISGSSDANISVCDLVTRRLQAALSAQPGGNAALAVCDQMLLNPGDERTITIWALGTWDAVRRVLIIEHVPDAMCCLCLAASGTMLLCGGTQRRRVRRRHVGLRGGDALPAHPVPGQLCQQAAVQTQRRQRDGVQHGVGVGRRQD